jgi:hypothetical protein
MKKVTFKRPLMGAMLGLLSCLPLLLGLGAIMNGVEVRAHLGTDFRCAVPYSPSIAGFLVASRIELRVIRIHNYAS